MPPLNAQTNNVCVTCDNGKTFYRCFSQVKLGYVNGNAGGIQFVCGSCGKYAFPDTSQDGDRCPSCKAVLKIFPINFPPPLGWICTMCGTQTYNVGKICDTCLQYRYNVQSVPPPPQSTMTTCGNCGGVVPSGVQYCPTCAVAAKYAQQAYQAYRNAYGGSNSGRFNYGNQPNNPYPNSSNTTSGGDYKVASGSVKIWWDDSIQAYKMVTPFNKDFVELLKQLAPGSDRIWDPPSKTWTISERIVQQVISLAEKAFKTTATFVSKQQHQAASRADGGATKAVSLMPADKVILEFFHLLPYEAAKKAWQVAAMQLHPDRGGSLELMTKLNAAWARIEKDHYKKE